MFRKILFLFTALTVSIGLAFGQAKIEFKNATHDFGNVTEGAQATHEFTFTNTGDAPLIIHAVRASCGCTTPDWTKEPVLPGKQGKVTASYNSKSRPGAFNKNITITTNATEPTSVVFIKGVVVGQEVVTKVYSDEAIAASPKISIDNGVKTLGKVEKGQDVSFTMMVKNTGQKDLDIQALRSGCNCISLDRQSVKSIKPGKSEAIKMIYSARQAGNRSEGITLISNDITQPELKVIVQADVVESLTNKSIIKENKATITF